MNQQEVLTALRGSLFNCQQAAQAINSVSVHLDREERASLIVPLDSANYKLEELIEKYAVKSGDSHPLDETEERVYFNLNKHLRLPQEDLDKLTAEQLFSAARVIHRQGYSVNNAHYSDGMLGIKFNHIYIGIEPDGYAHS